MKTKKRKKAICQALADNRADPDSSNGSGGDNDVFDRNEPNRVVMCCYF
ncbi:MAG: hypothetical protein LBR26_04470 [Prevotella sp.]|jgi:hypothetical protein|nr:hypothetical protein [Prevotella sp.]